MDFSILVFDVLCRLVWRLSALSEPLITFYQQFVASCMKEGRGRGAEESWGQIPGLGVVTLKNAPTFTERIVDRESRHSSSSASAHFHL